MEFIVGMPDGNQEGPIDQETLRKWVGMDKVVAATPVRNALVTNWRVAQDFEFLKEDLALQAVRFAAKQEEKKGFFQKILAKDKPTRATNKEISSAFKYEYIPKPAGPLLRTMSGLSDLALAAAFALILLAIGMAAVYMHALSDTTNEKIGGAFEKTLDSELAKIPALREFDMDRGPTNLDDVSKGFGLGSLWKNTATGEVYACISPSQFEALWCSRDYMNACFAKLFAVFVLVTLFCLGFALGFFAQTPGMWFWGIFIVEPGEKRREVLPLRAFCFGLLSIPFGFLAPFIAFVMPDGSSLHDRIAGVRLIGVSAKPKT